MRDASENSTSASVASARTRNDPALGDASIQPRPSVPTMRPAAVKAIAGGSRWGRHVSSAMNARTMPETAASDHVADAMAVIAAVAPRRRVERDPGYGSSHRGLRRAGMLRMQLRHEPDEALGFPDGALTGVPGVLGECPQGLQLVPATERRREPSALVEPRGQPAHRELALTAGGDEARPHAVARREEAVLRQRLGRQRLAP